MKRVLLWIGASQLGMAIVRRIGASMKIVVGDVRLKRAQSVAKELALAGFDIVATHVDISSKKSIGRIIDFAQTEGSIYMLVDTANVSPNEASYEKILATNLYGTAALLEEVGKVIAPGGCGLTVSNAMGHRLPATSPSNDRWLMMAPCDELLKLTFVQPGDEPDSAFAYALASYAKTKRVQAEAVKWGARGARINAISTDLIATPSTIDLSKRSDGYLYRDVVAQCPLGRPGLVDEVANLAQFAMSSQAEFITGSDFVVDGGSTAAHYCGGLRSHYSEHVKLYLMSSPIGTYRVEGVDYLGLNPKNGLIDELHKDWPKSARCLFIAADPDAHEQNVATAKDFAQRLAENGLAVDRFDVCDAEDPTGPICRLTDYDFLLFGGGHVPTQNAFFRSIGLFERIRDYRGIAMGISAGTMNCAETVYAQPELDGEATDPDYERFIEGLGLTEVQILPHYQAVKDDVVDGLRLFEDITFADSVGHAFVAIPDGSFVLQRDGLPVLHGVGYLVFEGQMARICEDGATLPLE